MRVLFRLFLRKFKRWHYNLSLGITILPILFKILKYIFRGIADEATFSWMLQNITDETGSTMLTENMVLIGIPFVVISGILVLMYFDARKEYRSANMINILNEMHSIMTDAVKERIRHKVKMQDVEDTAPILMDRLGIVELQKYDRFTANIKRRIKRLVPRTPLRNRFWYFRVLAKAAEIQKELVEFKEWQVSDGLIVCKWLEEQHWGVGELRDKSKKWWARYDLIRPYLADPKLKELIEEHFNYSYIACSQMLLNNYSAKWSHTKLSKLLLSVLIKSIDRMEIESGLNNIIIDISKRLKVVEKKEKTNEQVSV